MTSLDLVIKNIPAAFLQLRFQSAQWDFFIKLFQFTFQFSKFRGNVYIYLHICIYVCVYAYMFVFVYVYIPGHWFFLLFYNKIKYNNTKQWLTHWNRTKQMEGKESKRISKKQRSTCSHIQESLKNTKLEIIMYRKGPVGLKERRNISIYVYIKIYIK